MQPEINLPKARDRYSLGLWFCAIALLGGMRFTMKYREHGGLPLPPDSWLWLGGSTVCGIIGIVLVVRAWRKPA